MKLSEKIRILRKARGMSQEEFGYSLSEATEGVTRQTVSDWENGKFEPKLDNIRDIAKVLNVSFDVLLDESIDLNDAEILNNILNNNLSEKKHEIRSEASYDIRHYDITRKHYIRLVADICLLTLFILAVIFLVVGYTQNNGWLVILGYVFGCTGLGLITVAILGIIRFIKEYKNPASVGSYIGEINNTHLILHANQTAANIVCIPLEKIKEIRISENAKVRHGDVIILLIGREKPITLMDVVFPKRLTDFYEQITKCDGDNDPVKII